MARITNWTLAACAAALLSASAAQAQQPITPLGAQLQLTQHGAGSTDAIGPAVAWNSQRNEYMVAYLVSTFGGFGLESEVFVRRLAADGTPLSAPRQVSGLLPDGQPDLTLGFDALEVAIAYDFERDRYGVAYNRDYLADQNVEVQVQLVSAEGSPIKFDGTPGPEPRVVSNIGAQDANTHARDPAVVYSPDSNDDANPGDRFVAVYQGDDDANATFFETNVFINSVRADTGTLVLNDRDVSAMTATGDATSPTIARIPGSADFAVAWEGYTTSGADQEIWVNRVPEALPAVNSATQRQATATAPGNDLSSSPTLATDTDANQLLLAYVTRASSTEGFEIYRQRLDAGMFDVGGEVRVSDAGPPGSVLGVSAPAAAYNPVLKRFLVTWTGSDDDRPGLSSDELERAGALLAPDGTKQSEITISRMGTDNDEDFAPGGNAAVAANATNGRWFAVWSGDTTTDGLIDVYGRDVGENFDEDGDGARVDAGDCNDKDANVKPGANDTFDNGVDEDCKDGDAQNPDRDGDGSNRPDDCNDGNPFVKPGAADVPGNGTDEDCAGGDATLPAPPPAAPGLTRASLDFSFATFPGRFTQVRRFRVLNAAVGMTIRVSCKGRGCPRKTLRRPRTITVRKAGRHNLLSLFKGARLRSGAKVEVRITETGAIGKVSTFTFRRSAGPKRSSRCIAVGKTSPGPCPR